MALTLPRRWEVTQRLSRIPPIASGKRSTHFRSAYASGNINQVRSLLTTRAFGWHSDRRQILKSYRELFDASSSRYILIDNPVWAFYGDSATVLAGYRAYIKPIGDAPGSKVSGDIRFDLRMEEGRYRIVRLRHEVHDGNAAKKGNLSQQ